MPILLKADAAEASEELWRRRLSEARLLYDVERTPGAKADYLRVLKQFTDLVLRREEPPTA